MTGFLGFLAVKTNLFGPVIPFVERGLASVQSNQIIDLGSGAGGGWPKLLEPLSVACPEVRVTLTDLHPNAPALQRLASSSNRFDWLDISVNAADVPTNLQGLRTLFLVFHHLRPNQALAVLQNAVDQKQPIAVFEAQDRSFKSLLAMAFSPLTCLLVTPWVRPFRWGTLVLTYVLPVIPLLVMWDGLVSSLRTYSATEWDGLLGQLSGGDSFEWQRETVRSGPGFVHCVLGTPKLKDQL